MKVSRLIVEDRRGWNVQMINEMFKEDKGELIRAIPLSRIAVLDVLIWNDSISGQFSVKSAYVKAREKLGRECNLRGDRELKWKKIWSAKVIPKIRMFM